MKVLLIIHDNYQDDNYFPLGPAYLAACLRDNKHDVDVYCMDVFHYTNKDLAEYLDAHDYDLIGLGFLAGRFKETIIDLSKIISDHKKNAKFIIGGHGPSPIPRYMLKKTNADIVAMGEAEESLVDIANGKELQKIKGIACRDGKKITINEKRKPIKILDNIPFPAWDLFPMKKYINSVKWVGWESGDKSFPIISSRGCISNCSFCYRLENGIRFRKMDNVLNEMQELHDGYGINFFILQDNCFVTSEKRVKEFAEGIQKLNFKIKYSCESRVDIFNENIAKMLKDSGCVFVNFGFEADTQCLLDTINKNTTVEDNHNAAKIAEKYNLPFGLNFIWNLPGDTKDDLLKRVGFIKQYDTYSQIRTIKPVTPYPGCKLFYKAIDDGLLKDEGDFFNKFENLDLITVNFMDIPNKDAYKILFEVNKELILDHFQHIKGNDNVQNELIEQFQKLYFEGFTKFRGSRHYD
jgi:anaerobic magnesium-protoporphyrin IX monomethyl ester cyclase